MKNSQAFNVLQSNKEKHAILGFHPRDKAAMLDGNTIQYNFFSQNLQNNKVQSPEERQVVVLVNKHGHHDVRRKPANRRTSKNFL